MSQSPLLTAAGLELLSKLTGEAVTPERALELSATMRRHYPPDLVAAALTQQALREAGRVKFSAARRMLFTRAGLEQASSEPTARHAAARFAGAVKVADLCCGIGGNLAALADSDTAAPACPAAASRKVLAADADPASLEFARHNVAIVAPGSRVSYVCADVRDLRLTELDAVFIDPARRDERGRLPAGQYHPSLAWCLSLADTVPRVCVKAAPGLRADAVPAGWEVEFVAVGRDLKQALLWSPAFATAATRATVLPTAGTMAAADAVATADAAVTMASADAGRPVRVAPPGAYLLDPNPAITRAGLVTDLARSLGAWQIDPMIAFLSCDQPVQTPFARTLRVIESAPWHERRFARRLRELGIGSADIRRRGLAGDVRQIHRRLALSGDGAATIVLTRVADQPWGLICVQPAT